MSSTNTTNRNSSKLRQTQAVLQGQGIARWKPKSIKKHWWNLQRVPIIFYFQLRVFRFCLIILHSGTDVSISMEKINKNCANGYSILRNSEGSVWQRIYPILAYMIVCFYKVTLPFTQLENNRSCGQIHELCAIQSMW